jgi:hypothetical protein
MAIFCVVRLSGGDRHVRQVDLRLRGLGVGPVGRHQLFERVVIFHRGEPGEDIGEIGRGRSSESAT